ncbi:hypothetical protein DL96DRAFT_1809987 [Flagelloscypha sp. PMI_526]|nr:hypothetical protein DL96DRAFT_1809987 [Flagelloscypha sp. PMI_526]
MSPTSKFSNSFNLAFFQAIERYLPVTLLRSSSFRIPATAIHDIRAFILKKTSISTTRLDVSLKIYALRANLLNELGRVSIPSTPAASLVQLSSSSRVLESIRKTEPSDIPQNGSVPACGSMTRRRQASNIPSLQRHISFQRAIDQFNLPMALLTASKCITPVGQLIHTPLQPPSVPRRASISSHRLSNFCLKSPMYSPSTSSGKDMDLLALDLAAILGVSSLTSPAPADSILPFIPTRSTKLASPYLFKAPLGSPFVSDVFAECLSSSSKETTAT